MKKTMLLLAATVVVASSAFARPCRVYSHCSRRPCVVRHYYHRSHTWHGSDWGKFAAGAAFGWIANEAASAPRETIVYSPQPVYQAPVYVQPTIVQPAAVVLPAPVVQQPVLETVTTTPNTTIVTRRPVPVVTAPPIVTVVQPETVIRTDNSTTIIRQNCY